MARGSTLLFGIGATKAATSWLYRYLAKHPQSGLRTIKELHFWDAVEEGAPGWRLRDILNAIDKFGAQDRDAMPGFRRRYFDDLVEFAKILEALDQDRYAGFVLGGADGRAFYGEITPSYSNLSEATFRQMAALTDDVRFLFILRDPVSRMWSHARMLAARRSPDGSDIPARANRIMKRAITGDEPDILARVDYRYTLETLDRVTDADKIFMTTYERLFQQGELDRLCAWLGAAPFPALEDRVIHAGPWVELNNALADRAAEALTPQYDYIGDRLGGLPAGWRPVGRHAGATRDVARLEI